MQRLVILEENQNYIILGPRQAGKSTLIKSRMRPEDLYINLLPSAEFIKYSKDPGRFHAEITQHHKTHKKFTCYVDEIQKIPELLNDVHDLIESTNINFILTGSSVRKLHAKGTNLLAGRAFLQKLHPCVYSEIGEIFNLEIALKYGTLPKIWNGDLMEHKLRTNFLKSYAQLYLQEEIQQEALVRNIPSFTRFLDIAAANDGQLISYSALARDCGVSTKTAMGYYEILNDTFMAHRIDGWSKSARKQLTSQPKYYFFDCGISNALTYNIKEELNFVERGRKFEQFCILQLIALNSYLDYGFRFFHWRDKNAMEVDLLFVKGDKIIAALEFKSSTNLSSTDTKGLLSFQSDNEGVPCYLISTDGLDREMRPGILHSNWKTFIEKHLEALSK